MRRIEVALCLPAALALALLACAPAGAWSKANTYLALGDSLAFGYSQQKFEEDPEPGNFEEGYVNFFAQELQESLKQFKRLTIVNDGCPGETSASFIGESEPPCPFHNVEHFRLHHEYTGSQLADALAVLHDSARRTVDVVTLDIGANDLNNKLHECEQRSKEQKEFEECVIKEAPGVFKKVYEDTARILGTIRSPAGGNYGGRIVLLGIYNPYGKHIGGADLLTKVFDSEVEAKVAAEYGASFANPYPSFNGVGEPQEQERLCRWTHICDPKADIHPTREGYEQLAKLVFARFR